VTPPASFTGSVTFPLGSALVVLLQHVAIYTPIAATVTVLLVFALRVAALRYSWRAPHPRQEATKPRAPSSGA